MGNRKSWPLFALAALLAVQGLAFGDTHYKVVNGPANFYYGHISFVETKAGGQAPQVWREGRALPETAVVNLPLGPGDLIRTSADSRGEIQFDTATVIRLDFDTELKIETVLAQSLSSPQQVSNLTLSKGRIYVLYKQYGRLETFQILTGNAALKLKHNTVAMVRVAADKSTDVQVKTGKASVLYGPDEKSLKEETVNTMKRLIIVGDRQVQPATYIADTDFELWNNDINAKFDETHKGKSALPKPIQKLPEAVFYFAQNYGNIYGEWLWDDIYGYVWHPFINNYTYPWGWAPYFYGEWSYVGNQMFWVPEEPWGWIPYHLGIWQWDKKLGWVWLPGSMFAPAWVDWEFFFGYPGWRPFGLMDWYFHDDFWGFFALGYFSGYFGDGLMGPAFWGWDGFWSPSVMPGDGTTNPGRTPLTTITKDQLKDPGKWSLYPLSKELKSAYKSVVAAYQRQDPRIIDSLKAQPGHALFVNRADLSAAKIQDKVMTWQKVSQSPDMTAGASAKIMAGRQADLRNRAVAAFVAGGTAKPSNAVPVSPGLQNRVESLSDPANALRPGGAGSTARPAGATIRNAQTVTAGKTPAATGSGGRSAFLDWNPDLRVARELGVHIEYSARTNQIRCPELKLTSADRVRVSAVVPTMTTGGVSFAPVSTAGSYSSPTSSSSQSSSHASSSGGSSSAGSGGSSTSGGRIKN